MKLLYTKIQPLNQVIVKLSKLICNKKRSHECKLLSLIHVVLKVVTTKTVNNKKQSTLRNEPL